MRRRELGSMMLAVDVGAPPFAGAKRGASTLTRCRANGHRRLERKPRRRCALPSPLGLLVGLVAAWVVGGAACSDESAGGASDADQHLETIRMAPGSDPPRFVFPEAVRTDDESLNAFVERFTQICIDGEYDKYRLTVRRRSRPVQKDDFENVWHNIEEVRIEHIVPLPDADDGRIPRYALFANVRLRPGQSEAEKLVVMQILREGGEWVIDVLGQEEMDLVRALAAPTSTAPASTQAVTDTP